MSSEKQSWPSKVSAECANIYSPHVEVYMNKRRYYVDNIFRLWEKGVCQQQNDTLSNYTASVALVDSAPPIQNVHGKRIWGL